MHKKILLLHVPYAELYTGIDIRKLGWGIPPLGLAALSAYLKKKVGCQVRLIDMLFQNVGINDITGVLKDFQPDIVGLSATTPQMNNLYSLSRIIKKTVPQIKVVAGGAHASALPERTLKEEPSIDYIIIGEGEIPFTSLIQGKIPDSIKGLAWRKEGRIVINEREALIEDLGGLPFPDYESLPLSAYGTFYSGNSAGIMSGRGCNYNCSFCASRVIHQGRYRFRPIEIFLHDIERLLSLGVPRFDIWDDTFTYSKPRVYEFLDGYRKKGLKAHWACETRADCLDEKLLKEMHRSGMDVIHIGCESGSQDVLNKIGKLIKLEQVTKACNWCKKQGITVYVYFMLGFPYDTKDTIRETIAFSKKLPIDFAQFSMLVPLPGTRIWKYAEEGKILRNLANTWSDYDRYRKAIIELNNVSAKEITKLYRYAVKSFYLRPYYLLSRVKKIKNLAVLKAYLRMSGEFFNFLKR